MDSFEDAPALPMEGIRILDCATFVAAPFAASVLGEFGAEVIKIEDPRGGDPWRKYGTPTERGDSLAWLTEARNKGSVTLNLKTPDGAALFKRLVAVSDVVCENFRPGTLERWGLGWDVLSEINPRLILLRVSGYGQTGPYRDRPGFARIAQAFGGLTHLAGMPGGPPVTPGSTSLADYMTGLYGAVGILLALRSRDASGRGQYIDIGLYESVFRVLDELVPAYARNGTVRGREGIGTRLACPHGHFECGDGGWVAIACTSDRMFERLAGVMGHPELAAADRFATTAQRVADRDYVDGLVSEFTRARSREDVIALCEGGEVPCGPVNDISDIFRDPQFAARGNLLSLDEPDLGEVVVPGVLPKLSRNPGRVRSLGPRLGDSNVRILRDLLGLEESEIERLRAAGAI